MERIIDWVMLSNSRQYTALHITSARLMEENKWNIENTGFARLISILDLNLQPAVGKVLWLGNTLNGGPVVVGPDSRFHPICKAGFF